MSKDEKQMEIRSLADSFRHCPGCGIPADEVGHNPFECDACGYTLFMSPITAVAAIIVDSDGRVLFLRRAKDPGKGKLGLPGGFVDPGERLEDALVREVFEETNLNSVEIKYLTSFPNTYVYRGIALSVTDMFFSCRVESFDSMVAQQGEVDSIMLAHPTPDLLSELAFVSNRLAIEKFARNQSE